MLVGETLAWPSQRPIVTKVHTRLQEVGSSGVALIPFDTMDCKTKAGVKLKPARGCA